MKKQTFIIPVIRSGFACRNIEVEATSQKEAERLALDEAGDHEFSEHTSEYSIDAGVIIDYEKLIAKIKNQLKGIDVVDLTKAEKNILDIINSATN